MGEQAFRSKGAKEAISFARRFVQRPPFQQRQNSRSSSVKFALSSRKMSPLRIILSSTLRRGSVVLMAFARSRGYMEMPAQAHEYPASVSP